MIKLYNLHVCLPCRDRLILTQKTIESIHYNFKQFKNINIYVFDNYSIPSPDRMMVFSKLLQSGKICYYSYDTAISTHNCFPKAVIFKRFTDMMNEKRFINQQRGVDLNCKDVYLLTDNDMIYGPRADEYFLTSLDIIEQKYPFINFLVKYPGGIPKAARDQSMYIDIQNKFKKTEEFKICMGGAGGGGGCWVMSHRMLNMIKWTDADILKVYGKFKMHDVITWRNIKSRQGSNSLYVAGIMPINSKENPLVIHMGGKVGSVCNALTNRKYGELKQRQKIKEEELLNISAIDIFNSHKHLDRW